MQQELSNELMSKLGTLKDKLPDDIYVGRVKTLGPRKTWQAVIDWMIDTHPVTSEILKGTENDAGNN